MLILDKDRRENKVILNYSYTLRCYVTALTLGIFEKRNFSEVRHIEMVIWAQTTSDWKVVTALGRNLDVGYGQWKCNEQLAREKSLNVPTLNYLFFFAPSLLRTLCDSRKQHRWHVGCRVRRAAVAQRYPIVAAAMTRRNIATPIRNSICHRPKGKSVKVTGWNTI